MSIKEILILLVIAGVGYWAGKRGLLGSFLGE